MLKDTFERKGIASQLRIRKKLLTMKYESTETMSAHFLNFDKLIRELKSTGAMIEEVDVVCHLLLTLSLEYDAVVTALETLSTDQLKLSFVKNRLLDEEAKRSNVLDSDNKHVAFATKQSKDSNAKFKGKNKAKFTFQCHNCGKYGHKRADCRKPQKDNKGESGSANLTTENSKKKSTTEKEFAFNVEAKISAETVTWFLDSSATEHLARSSEKLENLRALRSPIQIYVAKSGQKLTATECGDFKVRTQVNGLICSIMIKDVLLVPNLQFNLLSVRRLEMNGYTIHFGNGKGIIRRGNCVVAVAYRKDRLYELDFCATSVAANLCNIEDDVEVWHKRYGHIGYDGLQQLSSLVNGIKLSKPVDRAKRCEVCISGKQTKLPHSKPWTRATRPLQLVHSDVCGPMGQESHDKKKYLVAFIDDYTHFTMAYTLSEKSEVFKCFKQFHAMAEAHFNTKLSRLRCDNGREYPSTEMKNYCASKGIQYEFTIRYTPQQNGVAERMNRTIIERARCMILNASMSKSFWSEAVLTAVYLINRSPTEVLKRKVPAELWYGENPDVQKLRVFGCIAYLRLPKELIKGKFDSRSKKCRMVGYCANGYRLWCQEEKKIVLGRDVIFEESRYNFNEDFYKMDSIKSSQDKNPAAAELKRVSTKNEESELFEKANEEEVFQNESLQESEPEDMSKTTLRRSSRIKIRSKRLEDYICLALNAEAFIDDVPKDYCDIDQRDDKDEWSEAVQEEINSLLDNNTWIYTKLPEGKRAIDNKWVLKIKRDQYNNVQRYKARLVIKGCAQRKGFDYTETYAPVAHIIYNQNIICNH